jgi:hypothetical protein
MTSQQPTWCVATGKKNGHTVRLFAETLATSNTGGRRHQAHRNYAQPDVAVEDDAPVTWRPWPQ